MTDVTLSAAGKKLAELNLSLSPEIDYDLSSVFPKLEGMFVNKGIKAKVKLIKNVENRLTDLLGQGEQVLFVSKGVQYSFWEQYLMGIWALSINQTVFVLTNVRLIMLRTNGKGVPKQTMWTVYYNQIKEFKGGLTGMLTLKLTDGKIVKFSGFSKADRKNMNAAFEQALEKYKEYNFDPTVTQSLENLCGDCLQVVPKDEYECSKCGTQFWTPKEIGIRSFVVPSWGDFAMKHYTIAAVELVGTIVMLFVMGIFISEGDYVLALIVYLFSVVGDALVTAHIAKKGLHIKKRAAVVE